jgi:hypothetical protein
MYLFIAIPDFYFITYKMLDKTEILLKVALNTITPNPGHLQNLQSYPLHTN